VATPDELVNGLEDAAKRARDLKTPLTQLGGLLLTDAAPRSPRSTGLLAGSVVARATAGLLSLSSPVRYFRPVHNGRKRRGRVAARPWLADTLKANERQATQLLEAHVLEPIERL